MEGIKHGQRLLMALYPLPSEAATETVSLGMSGGVLAAVGGLIGLLFVVLMCACKDGEKKNDETAALQGRIDQNETQKADGAENKHKAIGETVVPMTNGGPTTSSNGPGHSRQASASSVHNMRPTSLRELPEPPVSNHTRNASLSGIEVSVNSMKGAGSSAGGPEYAYPQHLPQHGNRGAPGNKNSMAGNGASSENKVKSHSDGYDHLRPKISSKPTDYDSLVDHDNAGEDTPMSDTGSAGDGHYSHLPEEEYAIVNEVKAKSQSSDEHFSGLKAKPLIPVNHYSHVTDEDPYNHIGDSDGAVSASFIHRLKSNTDVDPYSTCQDTAGDLQSILEEMGAVGGGHHLSAGGRSPLTPPKGFDDYRERADEYAVVNKTRGDSVKNRRSFNASNDAESAETNVRPPEPPRMYDIFDDDVDTFPLTATSGHKREHKYSKVTARESLASMTERNALNPYEMVPDLPENTYATVEGGSGDGVMMRSGSVAGSQENRLSQSSDTYAEIGISGGGLSTSVISNSSSVGGNNNSSSSGAPVPPSLDSLHMMTKSQTSSEGDRLSDRHLASPEDTGLNPTEDDDSGDSMEDGYSTLKRTDGFSPRASALPNSHGGPHMTDEESGEVTLISSYQSVKDCISDNEAVEDLENDPNYESVDETRAKVAALRARENSSSDSRNSEFKTGATNGAAVVKVLQSVSSLAQSSKSEQLTRRRLDHDYEEVDITPPSSPLSSHRTMSAALSSSQHSSQAPSHFSNDTNFKGDRAGTFDSHMYEELAEVRAKKSDFDKTKKGMSLGKSSSDDKKKGAAGDRSSGLENKKKSSSMDKKSSSIDKKKMAALDKRKSDSEAKKKSNSVDKKKTGAEDKKRGEPKEKKKEDKKRGNLDDQKKQSTEDKHQNVTQANGGSRV